MEEDAQNRPEAEAEENKDSREVQQGKKRAIIVDDSTFMRKVLRDFLQDQGIEVAGEAGDGVTGFALFRELNPDIMFIDIMMPFQDGLETLKEIKKTNPWAKVIIMTSLDPEEAEERAKDLGAWSYLTKPIDRDKVADLLDKIK